MSARPRTRRNQAGALLALFLLAVRLAVPPYAIPAPADPAGRHAVGLVGLLGGVPICHTDAGPAPAEPEPVDTPAVPAHDCALCPVCQLACAPALMPTAAWVAAAPSTGLARVALPPPSTGPPPPERYAAPPRGPPALVV